MILLNSDENILNIYKQSNDHFAENEKISNRIQDNIEVFRSLTNLVPETLENFWSGHIFPLTEAEYDLESSVQLCKLGFYKHAISTLRNVLELGLLSVYFDVDGKSHVDIQNWLRSSEKTPFLKKVFIKLKTHHNIDCFDNKHGIVDQTNDLYGKLCNFTHTKGMGFSSRHLGNSNINTFNEKTLLKWLEFMTEIVRVVAVFHILKYPIGFQDVPLCEKFGLNQPVGGFLESGQTSMIKNLLDEDTIATIQEISDNDPETSCIIKSINELPDITEEEISAQIEEQDKFMIEMEGFENWCEIESKCNENYARYSAINYLEKRTYINKMKNWAEKNGFMKSKRERANDGI